MFRFPLKHGSASSQSLKTDKKPMRSHALFKDLSSAHTTITARSTSAQQDRDLGLTQGPLPVRPDAVAQPFSYHRYRSESVITDRISQCSSYGDTRNLLNISTEVPPIYPRHGVGSSSSDVCPPPLSRAFSTKDSHPDNGGPNINIDDSVKYPAFMVGSQLRLDSESEKGKIALERQISKELRHISRLSGLSSLSGSIILLDGKKTDSSSMINHSEEQLDLGPGGSQSSSSHGALSRVKTLDSGSLNDGNLSYASFYRYNQAPMLGRHGSLGRRIDITGEGSFASFVPRTESFIVADFESTGKYQGDEDLDWVTVGDSRAFNNHETENDLPERTTGSSLADYSSNGSFTSQSHQASQLPPLKETVKHPANVRYQHKYRSRRASQNGQTMMLPEYGYATGNSFPHRNALSTPMVSSSINKSYQHPTPLEGYHTHPFNSSPPLLGSGRKTPHPHNIDRSFVDKTWDNGDSDSEMKAYPASESHGEMPKASKVSTTESVDRHEGNRHQVLSFASSLRLSGFDVYHPSGTWISTTGDMTTDVGNLDARPESIGSFSKMTTMGPGGNITCSPKGTGIRQVGSSPVDRSSSSMIWSSSPPQSSLSRANPHESSGREDCVSERDGHHTEEPAESQLRCKLSAPCEAVCGQQTQGDDISALSEVMSGQRQHLRTQGISHGTIANSECPQMVVALISPSSAREHGQKTDNSMATDPSTASINQTPPLPQLERKQAWILVPSTARLETRPRAASSIATISRDRKKILSLAVLGVCCLFPPLLMLYGYGYMDGIISDITDGQLEHFGRTEKGIALWLGWGLATTAAIALVIGTIFLSIVET